MKRNLFLFITIVIFNLIFRLVFSSFTDRPNEIFDLENLQTKENEKYITAQILSQSFNQVYAMFEYNLATKKNDERNQDSSLPFLQQLTDILEKLEIKTLKLKPKPKEKMNKFTAIPYEIELLCSFDKFGKFVLELERNNRLINIDNFVVHNGAERISNSTKPEDLIDLVIELTISTITLNKK
mgnify:CR=1 FL=1